MSQSENQKETRMPRKEAAKPDHLRVVGDALAQALSGDAPAPPVTATRPVLLESDEFRADMQHRLNETEGEIAMIDAAEAQAEADFTARIALETERREATRRAQRQRREDLDCIRAGCTAALEASGASWRGKPSGD